ncbi:MAG: type II toxin-antitoxin system RelE/ParE family toxin [Lunatimonas sp.]|uniref:type II toxin-antitoxin system RelE/ParE family toxin n=1 Tax=Lunatimonas sp. TaxID=2060141 RepID=UPI002A438299|nr:type II toxin-antitoxin system RelE/ParE family toxin [Lunatimonas sp.]
MFYADTVRGQILLTTGLLESQPQMGTIEPLLTHKKFEYRFLLVWSYKIIYRTTKDKVIISRVFHTSRSPKTLKGI